MRDSILQVDNFGQAKVPWTLPDDIGEYVVAAQYRPQVFPPFAFFLL